MVGAVRFLVEHIGVVAGAQIVVLRVVGIPVRVGLRSARPIRRVGEGHHKGQRIGVRHRGLDPVGARRIHLDVAVVEHRRAILHEGVVEVVGVPRRTAARRVVVDRDGVLPRHDVGGGHRDVEGVGVALVRSSDRDLAAGRGCAITRCHIATVYRCHCCITGRPCRHGRIGQCHPTLTQHELLLLMGLHDGHTTNANGIAGTGRCRGARRPHAHLNGGGFVSCIGDDLRTARRMPGDETLGVNRGDVRVRGGIADGYVGWRHCHLGWIGFARHQAKVGFARRSRERQTRDLVSKVIDLVFGVRVFVRQRPFRPGQRGAVGGDLLPREGARLIADVVNVAAAYRLAIGIGILHHVDTAGAFEVGVLARPVGRRAHGIHVVVVLVAVRRRDLAHIIGGVDIQAVHLKASALR